MSILCLKVKLLLVKRGVRPLAAGISNAWWRFKQQSRLIYMMLLRSGTHTVRPKLMTVSHKTVAKTINAILVAFKTFCRWPYVLDIYNWAGCHLLPLSSSKKTPVLTAQQEGWYQLKELSVSSTVELLNAFFSGEVGGRWHRGKVG